MWRKEVAVVLLLGCSLACCYSPPLMLAQPPHLHSYFPQDNEIQGEDEVGEWWGVGKRTGPSLSVVNPIEVLRSRLLLEMQRRKLQKQDNGQVMANRLLLKSIGKRHQDRSLAKTGERLEVGGEGPAWF